MSAGGDVLGHLGEGLALFGDQRGHPVMVGEADPARRWSAVTSSAAACSAGIFVKGLTMSL
jgi:hypothetical protein